MNRLTKNQIAKIKSNWDWMFEEMRMSCMETGWAKDFPEQMSDLGLRARDMQGAQAFKELAAALDKVDALVCDWDSQIREVK